jgi:hypothetical protein
VIVLLVAREPNLGYDNFLRINLFVVAAVAVVLTLFNCLWRVDERSEERSQNVEKSEACLWH